MCEFESFYLVLLALLDVLGIIGHDFEFVWNFELFIGVGFDLLFLFLAGVGHWSQTMQFYYFLSSIPFVPHLIALLHDLFNDARVELPIS